MPECELFCKPRTRRGSVSDGWVPHRAGGLDGSPPRIQGNQTAYKVAYDLAKDSGFVEAILVNELGEVVKGTRTNLWVRRDGF